MSQPKRYIAKAVIRPIREDNTYDIEAVEDANGDWVAWEDYEKLKQETIKQIETALPPVESYIAKLEAEVERLTNGIRAIDPLLLEAINSATLAKKGGQP